VAIIIILISIKIFNSDIPMEDKYLAEEFLDLLSSLPENLGASDYQYPIVEDKNGDC